MCAVWPVGCKINTRIITEVVAVSTIIDDVIIIHVATGWQEKIVTILGSEQSAFHAIKSSNREGRVVNKFIPCSISGHTPVAAPVNRGSIIFRQQDGQVIMESIIAIFIIVTILS